LSDPLLDFFNKPIYNVKIDAQKIETYLPFTYIAQMMFSDGEGRINLWYGHLSCIKH